jgi:hypothetical protein
MFDTRAVATAWRLAPLLLALPAHRLKPHDLDQSDPDDAGRDCAVSPCGRRWREVPHEGYVPARGMCLPSEPLTQVSLLLAAAIWPATGSP